MSSTGHAPGEGAVGLAISNLVVHVLNEYTGRGPTRAVTYLEDGLVTVVLRDHLSKGERRLVAAGRSDAVLALRRAYQAAMAEDLVAGVERLTGQHVSAFLSADHLHPDVAIESFILEPRS